MSVTTVEEVFLCVKHSAGTLEAFEIAECVGCSVGWARVLLGRLYRAKRLRVTLQPFHNGHHVQQLRQWRLPEVCFWYDDCKSKVDDPRWPPTSRCATTGDGCDLLPEANNE